jgi:hypothetical protein
MAQQYGSLSQHHDYRPLLYDYAVVEDRVVHHTTLFRVSDNITLRRIDMPLVL